MIETKQKYTPLISRVLGFEKLAERAGYPKLGTKEAYELDIKMAKRLGLIGLFIITLPLIASTCSPKPSIERAVSDSNTEKINTIYQERK